MRKLKQVVLLGLSLISIGFASSEVLQFKGCTKDQLEQYQKEAFLDMTWSFGSASHMRFTSTPSRVFMELRLAQLPSEFDFLIEDLGESLYELEPGVWAFSYSLDSDLKQEMNTHAISAHKSPDSSSYLIAPRRIFKEAKPKAMKVEGLSTIIRDKKVLFYTGAGLSIAAGVPGMEDLQSLMGLNAPGEEIVFAVGNIVKEPFKAAKAFAAFQMACTGKKPTKAHYAIEKLSRFKEIRVISENLDFLHEASGIHPYRLMHAPDVRKALTADELSGFDYVICAGLSFDDKGFLGWYKQCCPKGGIIAIDKTLPSYLGSDDFLVTGDLQEVLPQVAEHVTK